MIYNEIEIVSKSYTDIPVSNLVKHLNLDEDLVDNDLLEATLQSAIDWVETRTNSYVVSTRLKLDIYDFTGNSIIINHRGFNTVFSLKVNGETYTGTYKIIRKYTQTHIIFDSSISTESDIELVYDSGISPSKNFIQAVLIVAGDLYDVDRSTYSAGLTDNKTVFRLLNLL